jgi:hypothetical protein
MDGVAGWGATVFPLLIVSQTALDGNIPEWDSCGEAVETENEVRIV